MEEKLLLLGYEIETDLDGTITAAKVDFNRDCELIIKVRDNRVIDFYVFNMHRRFKNPNQVDHLCEAFDELQKDLKELTN